MGLGVSWQGDEVGGEREVVVVGSSLFVGPSNHVADATPQKSFGKRIDHVTTDHASPPEVQLYNCEVCHMYLPIIIIAHGTQTPSMH